MTASLLVFAVCVWSRIESSRGQSISQIQTIDGNGNVQTTDIMNGEVVSSMHSIDGNGNVQSSSVNFGQHFPGIPDMMIPDMGPPNVMVQQSSIGVPFPHRNFIQTSGSWSAPSVSFNGNTEVLNVNGNRFVVNSLNPNPYDYYSDYDNDEYYYDDVPKDDNPVRRYGMLMHHFIGSLSRKYNEGTEGDIPQYIFVHYYSGQVNSPPLIEISPYDPHQCEGPEWEFCVKPSRPMCVGKTTYCIAPLRKTMPCDVHISNGMLSCLNTQIANKDGVEENVSLPCFTVLSQMGTNKKYCVVTVVVNTMIRETMMNVGNTVRQSMDVAREAIHNGIAAGNAGLMRGMEAMRRAFAGWG